MERVLDRTIVHGDSEYHIVAEFDDEAIMDDSLTIEIQASVKNRLTGEVKKESVTLELSLQAATVVVRSRGLAIGPIPLNLALDDVADHLGNGLDILKEDNLIGGAAKGIEHLIQLIPADPLFGCLVKGAASTLIGQLIRCWRSRVRDQAMASARDIVGCLRDNGMRMALTFMFRVGRCVATFGVH